MIGQKKNKQITSQIKLQEIEKDRYLIEGELGFTTVSAILPESSRLFNGGSEIVVDLSGINRADSAGLALLLEWLGMARTINRRLKYRNIPEQIVKIAKISGLEQILTG